MKLLKTTLILITIMFLNNGKDVKSNKVLTDCETLFANQLDNLWSQLGNFQSTYLPDENDENYKWDYNFSKKEIIVSKNVTPYLKIDFIHVGSINAAKQTWTWSNRLKDKSSELYKVYELGVESSCQKLTDNSWHGDEKEAWKMVAMSNYILEGKGASRHYTPLAYNYVVFTQIQKI